MAASVGLARSPIAVTAATSAAATLTTAATVAAATPAAATVTAAAPAAATVTAAASATATSASAASATATSATATATTAFGAWARLIDVELSALQLFAVELGHRRLGFLLRRHLDEREPSRLAGELVRDDIHGGHLTEGLELRPQIIFGHIARDVSYVDVHSRSPSGRES
jgi:hypothetical protein